MLSYNYSWNTEYILNMPLHEIYWRLKQIGKRMNLDSEFTASLHGLKLEAKNNQEAPKSIPLSDNQKEAMKIALERARKRKKSEFLTG